MLPPDPDLAILFERRLAPLVSFGASVMLLAMLAARLALPALRSTMGALVACAIPAPRLVRAPGGCWPLAILPPWAIRRPLRSRPIASAGA